MQIPEEPKRILVLEEFDELREIMCDVLFQAGYDVTPVDSSSRAEVACTRSDFSLIVCNVTLPDRGLQEGASIIQRLALHCPSTPIIAMGADRDLSSLVALPPDTRPLAKPFGSDELLRLIDAALSCRC